MKVLVVQCILVALLLPNFSISLPVDSTTDSFVIIGDETLQTTTKNAEEESRPLQLKSMLVTSNIRNRYGKTVVSSKYTNSDSKAQEATFSINLPDTAFITEFVMTVKDKNYKAYVREKEQAKKEYQAAVSQGLGAAHVAVDTRDSNKFTVAVNVEPQSKVVFNLTYEQLLVRKHGKYEMVVNLNPGQLVKHLQVDVHINETRKIIDLNVPAIRSGNEIIDPTDVQKEKIADIDIANKYNVHITFKPTIKEQEEIIERLSAKKDSKDGIAGQFVVEYDVERDPKGGEVLVNDGYFVHFFAPSELKPIPKHVVFVLDVSGSMYGRKIEQLRQAMKIILGELNPNDYFNLVKFHSTVQVLNSNNSWTEIDIPAESELPEGFAATPENIKNAQSVVEEMRDEGLTNIIDALTVGLRMTSKGLRNLKLEDNKHKPQPIIVFLTDGQANVGESRPKEMIESVNERNTGKNKAAIFTLSFGNDANKEFLKELALKHSGFLRTIYEASDAALQLQDFYKQISSPLLTNVNFKYDETNTKAITKKNFDILFGGSELVVAGRLENPSEKVVTVEGLTVDGFHDFIPRIIPIPTPKPEQEKVYGSLERLWAYLTIKQLLDKKYLAGDSDKNLTDSENPEKQALAIALKFSFVTPVTSLVVVKPNTTDSVPVEERPNYLDESSALPLHFSSPAGASFSNRVSYVPQTFSLGMPGPPPPQLAFAASRPLIVGGMSYPTQSIDSFDADALFIHPSTTIRHPVYSTTTARVPLIPVNKNSYEIDELPWLTPLLSNDGEVTIKNEKYLIGNNATIVQRKDCKVESLSGNCTLLAECPDVYSELVSFQTYETKYFCSLDSLDSNKYAGVCCPERKED